MRVASPLQGNVHAGCVDAVQRWFDWKQAHLAHICELKLITMREVGSEDGSLAVSGTGVSKLKLGKGSSVESLRAMRGWGKGDVSPMGNTVKNFLWPNFVVYRAPLSFKSCTISVWRLSSATFKAVFPSLSTALKSAPFSKSTLTTSL